MYDQDDESFDSNLKKDIERFERFLRGEELGYLDVDRFEALIDHYLINSQYQKAIKCAQNAIQMFSFEPSFRLRLAQALSTTGKLKEALNVLSNITQSFGIECELLLTKATIFSQLKDAKRAIRYFEEALVIAPKEERDEVYLDLAMEYENLNQHKKAIQVLKRAIAENPQNEGAIYELAYCFERLGKHDTAIKTYTKFIEENPYSYTCWYNLGNAYSKIENHEKAIWAYDYCLLINPDFGAAHFNLGNVYLSEEKYRKAIESFEKCMEVDGDDPVALCYIGEAYEQLNELSLARMFYQRSIDMAPMMADAWLGMGIVIDLEGETFNALPFLLKAIELDPKNASYYHVIAGAYEKLNELDAAIENYEHSLLLEPTDEECLDNLMSMLLENDPLEAYRFILSFEENFGINPRTPLWITNVYYYLGRKTDALYYFREFFEENRTQALELFELNPRFKEDDAFKPFLESE